MKIEFEMVMDENGLVNRDETMDKFEDYLTNMCASQEKEQELIAKAVSDVFDNNMGKRVPLDYAIGQTCLSLNVVSENFKSVQTKVNTYLHVNAKGEDAIFNIGTGRGKGGIGRVKDLAK